MTVTAPTQRKEVLSQLLGLPISSIFDKASTSAKVSDDMSVTFVRKLMREKGYRSIAVIKAETGKFVGIITRGDVLMVSSSKSEATAGSLAVAPPLVLQPSLTVSRALDMMLGYDMWETPVTEGDKFLGFFSLGDVIRVLVQRYPEVLKEKTVSDYMTSDPVSALADDSVAKIWRKMVELRYAGLPVIDGDGRLIGMITQYDLLAKGYTRIHLESESGAAKGPRVRDAMTRPPSYVLPWSKLIDAADLMVTRGYGRVPVVNSVRDLKLIGIVDREDVIKVLR
jgi:CBS domain-containing protein